MFIRFYPAVRALVADARADEGGARGHMRASINEAPTARLYSEALQLARNQDASIVAERNHRP